MAKPHEKNKWGDGGNNAYLDEYLLCRRKDVCQMLYTHHFITACYDFYPFGQDMQSKVSDVVLGKEKPIEESTPEYEKMKRYIFELEEHLAEAQKHAFRLVKRHRGLGRAFCKLTVFYYLYCNCWHMK